MTAPRRDPAGQTPFGKWLQENPDMDSGRYSLAVTDADYIFHKYKTCIDSVGSRDVQLMMMIEVKTFMAQPTSSQHETLYMKHQLLKTVGKPKIAERIDRDPVALWHFGVFVLRLESDCPQARGNWWGRFIEGGKISYTEGSLKGLASVLRFDRRPDDPKRMLELRRHHLTRRVSMVETVPLGFEIDSAAIIRS